MQTCDEDYRHHPCMYVRDEDERGGPGQSSSILMHGRGKKTRKLTWYVVERRKDTEEYKGLRKERFDKYIFA